MSSLHGPSCGQPTADEANEAERANRTGKALVHKDSNVYCKHTESRDGAPDRQAGSVESVCVCVGGGPDTYKNM